MIDLIDYGGGNTGSIRRCLGRIGLEFRSVGKGGELARSDGPIVLPGVGSFGAVIQGLKDRGFEDTLKDAIKSGRPFLGICVGLQVLFEVSQEAPGVPGLGILEGSVERFRRGKIPQIGWNLVTSTRDAGPEDGYAYFVNSYVAVPGDPSVTLYEADYHGPFCAAVHRDAVTAYQFHPEKSGTFGHGLLRRWADAL
jgi:imidazole glycerol phosphate synthase glutamine amidotransferase subunit